jgi:lipoprotein-releasing system permease protein
LTPQGILTPNGYTIRPARYLRVAGIFALGLYEFDSTYGYVRLEVAERLFGKQEPDLIQLRVDDISRAPAVASAVLARFGPDYLAEDWSVMNKSLFSALWLEKIAVSLAIGLIVMVAALNIVASLILLVMDKTHDIAILKTMGASAKSITAIFMTQGLVIGLVGTSAGALLGVALSRVMDRYRVIRVPVDVYQVSYLPFKVLAVDLALVVSMAVLICFVATIYPSRRAAQLDPAQALRYE